MAAPIAHDHTLDLLEEALACARRGWSVVPIHSLRGTLCSCGRRDCPSVAKHPRIRWADRMLGRASAAEIAQWWGRWPDANLGIATGEVSGIVVLDIDPRNGGEASLEAVATEHGPLPATCVSLTGGGGRHYWFATGGEPVASSPLGSGLDVKGEGGLVVVPPSVHASGDAYRWAPGRGPDKTEPAPLPSWLRDLTHAPRSEGPASVQPPMRTVAERQEFGDAWERLGVALGPGDRYYLCPFHPDHHPSLHIDAEGCRWYCFGCGRGGGTGALRRELGEHTKVRATARVTGAAGRRRPVTIFGRRCVDIVGESHHQDALLDLCGGRRSYGGVEVEAVAELVPDPQNRFDPNAVEVRIDGLAVGHIRREDLDWLRPEVEDSIDLHGSATCKALIRGGWDRGRGDLGLFGLVLFLP